MADKFWNPFTLPLYRYPDIVLSYAEFLNSIYPGLALLLWLCRESALQNADDQDTVQKASKAPKRKAPKVEDEDETGNDGKPAKKKTFKDFAAERVKDKRTVFVGNLPVSCTREVLHSVLISN